jgi:4,5-dihydroxyphthalate decarboxylase
MIDEPEFRFTNDGHVDLSTLVGPNPSLDFIECGLITFLQESARGVPILALPVFVRASFRHSYIFVSANSGIRAPRDLEGKRVATRYEMTANVWARALLSDEYNVDLNKIRWVNQVGRREAPFKVPPGVEMEMVPPDVNLQDWLAEGKVDALIHPDVLPLKLLSRGSVRRLFQDAAAEEQKSYRRTKIVPVMNVIICRSGERPELIARVFEAFRRAKEAGIEMMEDNRRSGLLWYWKAWEDQVALTGRDPVIFSLDAMRPTMMALIDHTTRQGLLDKRLPVDDLFANV